MAGEESNLVYTDLVVQGQRAFGGCLSWDAFTRSDISTSLISNAPASVKLVSAIDLTTSLNSAQSAFYCGNSSIAALIVQALSTPHNQLSVFCDGHIWTAGRCTNDMPSYVCVDCVSKPCDGQYVPVASAISYASCGTDDIYSLSTSLNIMTISFKKLSKASKILSLTAATNASQISMIVSVDVVEGSLACAAYLTSNQFVPVDTNQLLLTSTPVAIIAATTEFRISGLVPSASYDVYCTTFSKLDVPLSLEEVKLTKTIVYTPCCRSLEVKMSTTSFSSSATVQDVLAIDIGSVVPTNLTMLLAVTHTSSGETSYPFSMKTLRFSSTRRVSLAYVGLASGHYTLSFTLTGPTAGIYNIRYSNPVITVVESSPVPDGPMLQSAIFSNDGSSVVITFDASTDRGGFVNNFVCNSLFQSSAFTSSTRCLWVDDSHVSVFSRGDNGIRVGQNITLLGNRVRAKCRVVSESRICTQWPYSKPSSITVLPPLDPMAPTVSIVAPAVISRCMDLTVDISGSLGAGGRTFSSVSFLVEGKHPNVSLIASHLNKNKELNPPRIVPSKFLVAGYGYNIILTLCNFLGGCGRGSHFVTVSSAADVPVVSINSNALRSVHRWSSFSVSGSAVTIQCASISSTANLEYSWKLYSGVNDLSGVVQSLSLDPRTYRLPPFALDIGVFYTLTLTVRHTQSLQASSASVRFVVAKGNVVAVVAGASTKSVRSDGSVTIDASGSYDEDIAVARGSSAGLLFEFTCVQLSPVFKATSDLTWTILPSGDVTTLSVPAGKELTDSIHQVTVIAKHIFDGRSSSATVTVVVLPSLAPLVSITSESGIRINPSQKLKLLAQVEVSSSATATWSVDDPSIALSAISLSDVQQTFPVLVPSTQRYAMSLVLPQDTLPQQGTFLFQLSIITTTGHTATAAISISTNSPPLPGEYSVSPLTGMMATTKFTFTATKFEDSDLPVTYEFAYIQSATEVYLVHRSRLQRSFAESVLPAGRHDEGDYLSTRLQVFDNLDAKYVTFKSVQVTAQVFSVEDTESYLDTALSNSNGYAEEMKRAVAFTSSLINAVNCSGAPDCAALNRMGCSSTIATCGLCLTGHIGEESHSNSKCVAKTTENRRRLIALTSLASANSAEASSSCVNDDDCEELLWSVCLQGQCQVKPKECSNDCNGAGRCIFVSVYDRNKTFSSCSVLDLNCKAICKCDINRAGESCELTQQQYTQTLQTRQKLAATIQTISLFEDDIVENLISWMNLAAALCSEPSGLNAETKNLVASMALAFLARATELRLSHEDITPVEAILDLVLNTGDDTNDPVLSLQLLEAYNTFVVSDLMQGQNAVQVINNRFRSSFQSITSQSLVTVAVPITELEGILETRGQSVQFPVVPTTDSIGFKMSVIETLAADLNLHNSSLWSVPLGLRFSESPCAFQKSANCSVIVTLRNARRHLPILNATLEMKHIECHKGVAKNVTHYCADGHVVVLSCNGTSTGTLMRPCPRQEYSMMCRSVGTETSPCKLLSFEDPDVTCLCSLPNASLSTIRRRLQVETVNATANRDESVKVDFASIGESTVTEFAETWESAGDLSATSVKDGIRVLITVAFLGIMGAVFIAYAHFLDHQENNKISAENASLGLRHADSVDSDPPSRPMSPKVGPLPAPDDTDLREPTSTRNNSRKVVIKSASLSDVIVSGVRGLNKSLSFASSKSAERTHSVRRMPSRLVGQAERARVEDSLPLVLKPLPLWQKFNNEIQMHHRWIGVICHYSPAYSRPLRVMSLLMNILTMLVIEAVTYDISDPDDGSCETYLSEKDCLREPSSLSNGETKCYWDSSNDTCHIRPIENDFTHVIMVTIISAVISAPFALVFQSLIMFVLAAETSNPAEERRRASTRRVTAAAQNKRHTGGMTINGRDTNVQYSLTQSMGDLMKELRLFREQLTPDQRREFDSK